MAKSVLPGQWKNGKTGNNWQKSLVHMNT